MSSLQLLLSQAEVAADSELQYPIVKISDLCQIHGKERNVFLVLLSLLLLCACLGNISTLYVNTRRKLRPFFRACLISLACSDLIYCVSFSTEHMVQFHAKYLELWSLGEFMCSFMPFVNSSTVMFSSLILVAIALDRYMAIKRAASGFWNPSLVFCIVCIGGIWLTATASAAPLFAIYRIRKVYLQTTEELVVSELQLASMCNGVPGFVGIYNVVLLSLIFVPCIVSFLFLNATIARQLWQRRHHHQHHQQQAQQLQQQKSKDKESRFVHLLSKPETSCAMMTAFSVAVSFDLGSEKLTVPPPPVEATTTVAQCGKLSPAAAARMARHRRMVNVMLLMMAAFICLRLPAWVFMLMRLYGSFSTPVDWLLYFSFGLLNLVSCALNPLFYTFLTQTIRVLSQFKQQLRLLLCWRQKSSNDLDMPGESSKRTERSLCCRLQVTMRCFPKSGPAPAATERATSQPEVIDVEPSAAASCNLPKFCGLESDIFTIVLENTTRTSASPESTG